MTDKHKNRRTSRLYDWPGPEGLVSENQAYRRHWISRRVLTMEPIQKETPKKTCVNSWISGVQYFSSFDHGIWLLYPTSMWWVYPTSMWRLYRTSIWRLYPTNMPQVYPSMWRLYPTSMWPLYPTKEDPKIPFFLHSENNALSLLFPKESFCNWSIWNSTFKKSSV